MSYNSILQTNNDLIQSLINKANNLPDASTGVEQATPEISVSSNGLITAVAGTKSSTYQLAFQAAKTITPSTASQIAVSSGYYTGGNITVNAIPSSYIIPSGTLTISANGTHNVKNYASAIVNVASSGGNTDMEDGLIERTITKYSNDRVDSIGNYAFYYYRSLTTVSFPACTNIGSSAFVDCSRLTTISFPACTNISSYAFYYCSSLTTASFPQCTTIGNYAFGNCLSLTTASFPVCTNIGSSAFYSCRSLTTISFPACININYDAFYSCSDLTTANFPVCINIGRNAFGNCRSLTAISLPKAMTIGSSVFTRCYNLKSLYLEGPGLCTLGNSSAFTSTPIGGYSTSAGTYGSIYVPASLLTSYQTATNWTYFSSRFVGIDGGSDEGNSGDNGGAN